MDCFPFLVASFIRFLTLTDYPKTTHWLIARRAAFGVKKKLTALLAPRRQNKQNKIFILMQTMQQMRGRIARLKRGAARPGAREGLEPRFPGLRDPRRPEQSVPRASGGQRGPGPRRQVSRPRRLQQGSRRDGLAKAPGGGLQSRPQALSPPQGRAGGAWKPTLLSPFHWRALAGPHLPRVGVLLHPPERNSRSVSWLTWSSLEGEARGTPGQLWKGGSGCDTHPLSLKSSHYPGGESRNTCKHNTKHCISKS